MSSQREEASCQTCQVRQGCLDLALCVLQTAGSVDGVYNPFPNFEFTGALRPWYPLSAKRQVPAHIPRPDHAETGMRWFDWYGATFAYGHVGIPKAELKERGQPPRILNSDEIEKMRTVSRVSTSEIKSMK